MWRPKWSVGIMIDNKDVVRQMRELYKKAKQIFPDMTIKEFDARFWIPVCTRYSLKNRTSIWKELLKKLKKMGVKFDK